MTPEQHQPAHGDAGSVVGHALMDLLTAIPASSRQASPAPHEAARRCAKAAAAKAATAAGTLALPAGPLGWLTVLPEMLAVWRIQARMVADIAALYGRHATLSREQMLYCLFKHTASQAVRDLAVRVGERVIVQQATLGMLQAVAGRVGAEVTQRALTKAVSRWLPLVGAAGVAAYAYHDTRQVAQAAIALFEDQAGVNTRRD